MPNPPASRLCALYAEPVNEFACDGGRELFLRLNMRVCIQYVVQLYKRGFRIPGGSPGRANRAYEETTRHLAVPIVALGARRDCRAAGGGAGRRAGRRRALAGLRLARAGMVPRRARLLRVP